MYRNLSARKKRKRLRWCWRGLARTPDTSKLIRKLGSVLWRERDLPLQHWKYQPKILESPRLKAIKPNKVRASSRVNRWFLKGRPLWRNRSRLGAVKPPINDQLRNSQRGASTKVMTTGPRSSTITKWINTVKRKNKMTISMIGLTAMPKTIYPSEAGNMKNLPQSRWRPSN